MALTISRIPERFRPGLVKVRALPIEVVSAIADALREIKSSDLKRMSATIKVAGVLSSEDADAIIVSLRSLYTVKASTEASAREIASMVVTATQANSGGNLEISDEERSAFVNKLQMLLDLPTLEQASKVEQLRSDHAVIFYDAKILTDLRPVFDRPDDLPIGAIISHTLKITCHEAGEHRELYFLLDVEDLETLKKISERASAKAISLKRLIASSNIPDFS